MKDNNNSVNSSEEQTSKIIVQDAETVEGDSVKTPLKVDAFQFMMGSRHKSIGRNSPGRDADLSPSSESSLSKQQLKVRKSRLESWAERKSAKRKREYEEVGNAISHKLEKRRKKLKKMLNVNCESDDEIITRKRRKPVVTSGSENGDDKGNEGLEKIEKNNGTAKRTPRSKKKWEMRIRLSLNEINNVESDQSNSQIDSAQTKKDHKMKKLKRKDKNTDSKVKNKSACSKKEECQISKENVEDDERSKAEEKHNSSSDCFVGENKQKEITCRRSLRNRVKPNYSDYFDEDEKMKKCVKVAPVFLKSLPKPKLDPAVVEARRQFLLSGVPSSLKKEMEKQQCIEETEFDLFPTVSHIQQKSDSIFWNLPKVDLHHKDQNNEVFQIGNISTKFLSLEEPSKSQPLTLSKVTDCRKLIKEMKNHNPDYPVYKIFNSIYNKSGYNTEKLEDTEAATEKPKLRGRPKKNTKTGITSSEKIKDNVDIHAMWTEKYRPQSSSDIIGNRNSVAALRDFLRNFSLPRKSKNSDSESDFIVDSDSRESVKMVGNTVFLRGPNGSGKTAAVYAACQELGFNILEVNASNKRTGKRLLQELQEATQSHQLCKKNSLGQKQDRQPTKPKKCVLLVEDVDVIFDQDEGFGAALSQIIVTSKRPIILTATDNPLNSIQKIVNCCQIIDFAPLTSILATWLQIVCLVEGVYVNTKSLEKLLNFNGGDIRRTMLQLQFYVHTNLVGNCVETIKCVDDVSNYFDSWHSVSCANLDIIWWNWPSILKLPDFASLRLDHTKTVTVESGKVDKRQLKLLSDCYDSLAFADLISMSKNDSYLEQRWRQHTKDGLGLEEHMSSFEDPKFNEDLSSCLLNGNIDIYKKSYNEECMLDTVVPVTSERRWRNKQLSTEDKLYDAFLLGGLLDRKPLVLDYVPTLRTMTRSEVERAANSTKRGKRFYNYLRNLGVCLSENSCKVVCDVFKV